MNKWLIKVGKILFFLVSVNVLKKASEVSVYNFFIIQCDNNITAFYFLVLSIYLFLTFTQQYNLIN